MLLIMKGSALNPVSIAWTKLKFPPNASFIFLKNDLSPYIPKKRCKNNLFIIYRNFNSDNLNLSSRYVKNKLNILKFSF